MLKAQCSMFNEKEGFEPFFSISVFIRTVIITAATARIRVWYCRNTIGVAVKFYYSTCSFGQLIRKTFSVARVRAV